MNFVITYQSSLGIHSAILSLIHSSSDNLMTEIMINNRTDACKTDVNLLSGTPKENEKSGVTLLCSTEGRDYF